MFQGWRCTQLQWESWICDIASMLKDLSVFQCQLSPKGDFWINFLALVMHSSCYLSLGSDSFIIHSTFNAIASAGLMWCWWSENFYFYPVSLFYFFDPSSTNYQRTQSILWLHLYSLSKAKCFCGSSCKIAPDSKPHTLWNPISVVHNVIFTKHLLVFSNLR